MKHNIFKCLDTADKLYAMGWLYSEPVVDGTLTVSTTRARRSCLQLVKKILGVYSKSNTLKLTSMTIVNALKKTSFADIMDNTFANAFCAGVFDKHGWFLQDSNKFVIDNCITNNCTPEVCVAIAKHLGMTFRRYINIVELSGSTIVDTLCPIYFNTGLTFISPTKSKLLRYIGGEKSVNVVLEQGAVLPSKAHYSDAGLDLSVIKEYKRIDEYTALYDTGVRVDVPIGYWSAIFPRSSISKSGFMVHNSVGVVDVSYRGTLLVALTKVNPDADITFPFRCAQLILIPQVFTRCQQVETIDTTLRGTGGYGSSG